MFKLSDRQERIKKMNSILKQFSTCNDIKKIKELEPMIREIFFTIIHGDFSAEEIDTIFLDVHLSVEKLQSLDKENQLKR